jgi:tRNA (cmo5U34)-methyltransferase
MDNEDTRSGSATIAERFDQASRTYDSRRRKLIPCFDDFYGSAVAAAVTANSAPRVLDIGAGTGILSAMIRARYSGCELVMVDIANQMLDIARDKFRGMERVSYLVGDYSEINLGSGYDLVVSALSIHHLDDRDKKQLFTRIFSLLSEGGVFVNADQCLGATPALECLNRGMWLDRIDKSGLPSHETNAVRERMKLDKMATLQDQLEWLQDAGFMDIGTVYQWFTFTVYTARKPGSCSISPSTEEVRRVLRDEMTGVVSEVEDPCEPVRSARLCSKSSAPGFEPAAFNRPNARR